MIFQRSHINLILSGLKTQTRRVNRGYYQEGKTYSIQPCRTCKGISDYRIYIDRIWNEKIDFISKTDAIAEGGYTPLEFEEIFKKINPKGDPLNDRWVIEFHVIKA